MAYVPPASDQVNFEIVSGYTPPASNAVDFDIGFTPTFINVYAPPFLATMEISVRVDTEAYAAPLTASPVLSGAPYQAADMINHPFYTVAALTGSGLLGLEMQPLTASLVLDIGEVYIFDPGAVYAKELLLTPELSMGAVGFGVIAPPITATIVLTGGSDFPIAAFAVPLTAEPVLFGTPWSNGDWLEFARSQGANAAKLYYCFVTGEGNGLTDLQVPITSFQSRRRSGSPSYLQVSIPGVEHYDAIALRLAGDLTVVMAYVIDGAVQYQEEIARVNLENVDFYKGGNNRSLTITGHKQKTYTSTKLVVLTNVAVSSFIAGKSRARMAVPDLYLLPGDTVSVDSREFVADLVTTTVSITAAGSVTSSMEVSED